LDEAAERIGVDSRREPGDDATSATTRISLLITDLPRLDER